MLTDTNTEHVRVAVVDNYDSFTYNLVHQLAELGAETTVFRNDETTVGTLADFDRLLISPGPGRPTRAGIAVESVAKLSGHMPILGVCLGHQCVGAAFGATIVRCEPVHGKDAEIRHDGSGVLDGLSSPFIATRYHSPAVSAETLPDELEATAVTTSDGVLMALRHRTHPTYGVQFHPESVLTPEGGRLIANFLEGSDDRVLA